jgi:hypothetical protein
MKTIMRNAQIKFIAIFTVWIYATGLYAQSLPEIDARFSNPHFDKLSRTYSLDVELNSKLSSEVLFGMNLRFYYDASLLEFENLDQFHQGYDNLGEAPKVYVGNENSGSQLFGFARSAGFVNGAIQLKDDSFPLEIFPQKWVKVFRVTFKVPRIILDEEHFCPGVVWDLKPKQGAGGFMAGSDGLIITVVEKNPQTRETTAPTITTGSSFNWIYNYDSSMPYGRTQSEDCISIAELVYTEEQNQVDANGYLLKQNNPNPFDDKTIIEFVLPFSQEATLKFFDVDGKSIEEVKGNYSSGKNQVVIKDKPWMNQSNVVFYRLETKAYTSGIRKMTMIAR